MEILQVVTDAMVHFAEVLGRLNVKAVEARSGASG
jgi:hypothetical protein